MINQALIDLQIVSQHPTIPSAEQLQQWLNSALEHLKKDPIELTIRIVDENESQELNHRYRQKNHATNVLSFASELPDFVDQPLLGDLIICAPVVEREALAQGKTWQAHWAHMVIHGTLHLLGYDHVNPDDAQQMESLEITLLKQLGFEDPYSQIA